jgi:hypothetical protein
MTLSSNSSISGHTAQGSASSGPQWKSLTGSKADMSDERLVVMVILFLKQMVCDWAKNH